MPRDNRLSKMTFVENNGSSVKRSVTKASDYQNFFNIIRGYTEIVYVQYGIPNTCMLNPK